MLFEKGLEFCKRGGTIDFTGNEDIDYWETICDEVRVCKGIRRMLDEGIDSDLFTITSDGQGSLPIFSPEGNFLGTGVGKSSCLLKEIRECVEMAGIPPSALVLDSDFDFKGPFVENYVLQQMASRLEDATWYYAERASREIDFVIQHETAVVPIEVKAGQDRKGATFKTYVKERAPQFAIRFSTRNLRKDGGFVNVPLYLAPAYEKFLL